MNNELLLLIKKHTDTLTEQSKTKHQETHDFKLNRKIETFSLNPSIKLVEEGEWLLGVTNFEGPIFVLNMTDENNSFPRGKPGRWRSPNYLEDGII